MSTLLHFSRTSPQEKRPVVVLLHGLFGDLNNLATIRRHLESEYDVLSVDLPDHGQSPHRDVFTLDGAVECLKATLDHANVAEATLLGHSLGGKIAMRFALNYPDMVNQLFVADIAPVPYSPRHQRVIAGLENVSLSTLSSRKQADEQLSEHINEPGVRQFLLKSLYQTEEGNWAWRFNLTGLKKSYGQISDWEDTDTTYNGKVLFIKGANSDYLQSSHREAISKYFPHAKAHIIDGAGHWLHAEKPQAFNAIVEKNLNKCN
ncbi:alpha/beta fold hydrolase [Alteromonas sp. H39]|uniref:alpha/beta fold hydrolase n=1 Tax=Alteromonas sp. H39 TaxID=3389876 RepID=UPI0039E03F95